MQYPLFINVGTAISPVRYELDDDDILYFAVIEPNHKFEDAIIRKVYTKNSDKTDDGDIILSLLPSETEFLLPGKYYYTIKLRSTDSGEVQTIIPMREFIIMD